MSEGNGKNLAASVRDRGVSLGDLQPRCADRAQCCLFQLCLRSSFLDLRSAPQAYSKTIALEPVNSPQPVAQLDRATAF